MKPIEQGGDVFPVSSDGVEGITLRDYLAAKAMQSDLVRRGLSARDFEVIATLAYGLADAMVKARKL